MLLIIIILLSACGKEDETNPIYCSPAGKYTSCVYTLEEENCAERIEFNKEWNGSLTLFAPTCSDSPITWNEGPDWHYSEQTGNCLVAAEAIAYPEQNERDIYGSGQISVMCSNFECQYTASFRCER